MPENYKEIDNIFFTDGYQLAESILKDFISPGSLSRLTELLYINIDGLLEDFESRIKLENKKIDCKESCHWCCTQAVFINPREALYILKYVRSNFNDEELSELKSRVSKKQKNTKDLSLKEQLTHKADCPFLKDRICSIYSVRPMACRIYLSMSLASCKANYNNPESEKKFAKLYDFPLHAGRMLNEGIASYLREKNIYVPAINIESGMKYFLQSDNSAELWLKGDKKFPSPEYTTEDLAELKRFEINE